MRHLARQAAKENAPAERIVAQLELSERIGETRQIDTSAEAIFVELKYIEALWETMQMYTSSKIVRAE